MIINIPICWGYEIFSGGLAKSAILAMLIPHLKVGAQKWTTSKGQQVYIYPIRKSLSTSYSELYSNLSNIQIFYRISPHKSTFPTNNSISTNLNKTSY